MLGGIVVRRKRNRVIQTKSDILALTTVIFLIITVLSIVYVNNRIKTILLDIAETRNEQYANMAIGIAIGSKIDEDLALGELITFQYDQNGRVVSYQVNAAMEAQIQRNIQYRVETFLHLLEQGDIPDEAELLAFDLSQSEINQVREQANLIEIPIGQALGLPLLANLGPKIPVNLESVGYVNAGVGTLSRGRRMTSVHSGAVVHINIEIRSISPVGCSAGVVDQSMPSGSGGYGVDVRMSFNAKPNKHLPL